MKTAIVYATKYGCTKECAEILKTYLHGEVNILSAKADKNEEPKGSSDSLFKAKAVRSKADLEFRVRN